MTACRVLLLAFAIAGLTACGGGEGENTVAAPAAPPPISQDAGERSNALAVKGSVDRQCLNDESDFCERAYNAIARWVAGEITDQEFVDLIVQLRQDSRPETPAPQADACLPSNVFFPGGWSGGGDAREPYEFTTENGRVISNPKCIVNLWQYDSDRWAERVEYWESVMFFNPPDYEKKGTIEVVGYNSRREFTTNRVTAIQIDTSFSLAAGVNFPKELAAERSLPEREQTGLENVRAANAAIFKKACESYSDAGVSLALITIRGFETTNTPEYSNTIDNFLFHENNGGGWDWYQGSWRIPGASDLIFCED